MRLIRSVQQMAAFSLSLRRHGKSIGVVPTLGALHEGHLSLIRRAVEENEIVIVTIFVNPLQFGPGEDFARYPRNLRRDLGLIAATKATIAFAPTARSFYPDDFQTTLDVGKLTELWEGRFRPGHFKGVATVVAILFHLTCPTRAYFGQKDYQQVLVIKQMVKDLLLPISIRMLPTVRERDGLALSSRNQYLSPTERHQAAALFQALSVARRQIRSGQRNVARLLATMRAQIRTQSKARVDYVAIVDAQTLRAIPRIRGRVALLAAVWIGRTRLIDNLLVEVS